MGFKVDWSKFKKLNSDKDKTVMEHSDGHQLTIAHKNLSNKFRKELDSLPSVQKMAEGGEAGEEQQYQIEAENPEEQQLVPGQQLQIESDGPAEPVAPPINNTGAPRVGESATPQAAPPTEEEISQKEIDNQMAQEAQGPQAAVTKDLASKEPSQEQPPVPSEMGAYQQQSKAIMEEGRITADAAAEQQAILKGQLKAQVAQQVAFDKQFKALNDEREALQNDIKNGHIDPNRYLGSLSTGQKIQTAIALFAGGFSASDNGGRNPAMEFINKQIDNDIEAQKTQLGQKHTLLSANMQQYGNLEAATRMTRAQMLDTTATLAQIGAAKSQSGLAKQKALQLQAELQRQAAPIIQREALLQSINTPSAGELIGKDPAELITALVPGDKQKEVAGQVEAAQNTKRMGDSIMKAFDMAKDENTVLKTGGGMLRTPASVYALHQAMQPTFKDLEGTVRQAAMDNTFKNITPQPGDSEHTIATKRQSLKEYLQSKASAPLAKAYGIDLEKFKSTASGPESSLSPQERTMLTLARKNPEHPNAKMIFKKLGIKE